jgi:hypothetical protein
VELPCWAVAIELITPKASVAAAIVQITHRMKSSLYHLLTNSLPTGRRAGSQELSDGATIVAQVQ